MLKTIHYNVAILVTSLSTQAFAQGVLIPSEAPQPSMKTLDQIYDIAEAATNQVTIVNATNTPGDTSSEFIISSSGSYRLNSSFTSTKTTAISIEASNVTLDLNGHHLLGISSTGTIGIQIGSETTSVTIHNGSISDFDIGIKSSETHETEGEVYMSNLLLHHLTVNGCQKYGVMIGRGGIIKDCVVSDNRNESGNCYGIWAKRDTIVKDCAVRGNYSNSACYGIYVENICQVIDCLSNANTGGTSTGTRGVGIFAQNECKIDRCSTSQNVGDGIRISSQVSVTNCNVTDNGTGTNSGGIQVTGMYCTLRNNDISQNTVGVLVSAVDNTIINNVISHNTTGIDVDSANNIIIQNKLISNTTAIDIVAEHTSNNFVGEQSTSSVATANPWANFIIPEYVAPVENE